MANADERPTMTHEVLRRYFEDNERDIERTLAAILEDYPEAAEQTPMQRRGLTPGTSGLEALRYALDSHI